MDGKGHGVMGEGPPARCNELNPNKQSIPCRWKSTTSHLPHPAPTLTLTLTLHPTAPSQAAKVYLGGKTQLLSFKEEPWRNMAIYSYVSGTIDLARRQADRVVSPHDRQKAYDSVLVFAQEQPLLFVRI
jgi:hypothetical protein